jgi:hypothetical protein
MKPARVRPLRWPCRAISGRVSLARFVPGRALLKVFVICLVLAGCKHAASPGKERPQTSASDASAKNDDNIDIFDPKLHPDATVIHAIDPATLTESQIKFGVAPRRDPSVEYQPDIILMENGDKAIKSAAGDGMTWTFDANAPQVSDFQEGKIVFATGRAVGRVLCLNREGDNVKVILGPVQLTEVIKNGHFEMNESIDPSKMISYVAPDYPQAPNPDEPAGPQKSSQLNQPGGDDAHMVLAQMSRAGKWMPATMASHFPRSRAGMHSHTSRPWSAAPAYAHRLSLNSGRARAGGARLVRTGGQSLVMPGAAGVQGIQQLQIPQEPFDAPKLLGQLPLVNLQGGQAIPMAGSDTSVGVMYDYDKDGLKLRASGDLVMGGSGIGFFLDIKNGFKSCGMRMKGNVKVKLHLNASASRDFKANFHRKLWLPIDMTIPLGGPVPLALTFNSSLLIETAFSAKTSVLNAEASMLATGHMTGA